MGMMLLVGIFWVAIIVGAIFLVRWLTATGGGEGRAGSSETALEILKKRYARGEITREQYELMRRDLQAGK